MSDRAVDNLAKTVPADFLLSVVMQRSAAQSPWREYVWEAIGITAARWEPGVPKSVSLVHQEGVLRHYLYSGFRLRLHADECESYYHNLCSPSPCSYVLARENEAGVPEPFRVSLSFDEANAYQEGEETVFPVAMPPELYRWCELFVLNHFVPERKKRRRRTDWRMPVGKGGVA